MSAPFLPDPLTEVKRSVFLKLGLPGYSSVDFGCTLSRQCTTSQLEEMSAYLNAYCVQEVMKAREEFISTQGMIAAPSEPKGDTSDAAFQRQARENNAKQTEANPFTVTAETQPSLSKLDKPAPAAAEPEPPNAEQREAPKRKTAPKKEKPEFKEPPASQPTVDQTAEKQTGPQLVPPVAVPEKEPYKATNDDLPANLQPEPEVIPPRSQMERIMAVVDTLATSSKKDPKDVKVNVQTFMKAALNVTSLPKPPDPLYDKGILPLLESLAKNYPGNVLSNPQKTGAEAGGAWAEFVRAIDKWDPAHKSLATDVALERYPDRVLDLMDFLDDNNFKGMEPIDQVGFLALCKHTSPAVAVKAKAFCEKDKSTLSVRLRGMDLTRVTEADVMTRLAGAVQVGQDLPGLWEDK